LEPWVDSAAAIAIAPNALWHCEASYDDTLQAGNFMLDHSTWSAVNTRNTSVVRDLILVVGGALTWGTFLPTP
jgi:aspartate oxidase